MLAPIARRESDMLVRKGDGDGTATCNVYFLEHTRIVDDETRSISIAVVFVRLLTAGRVTLAYLFQ